MDTTDFLESAARALELAGSAVILLGVIYATVRFGHDVFRRRQRDKAYHLYRSRLGRGVLLGLEVFVAADIIATVTAPLTLESVGTLGLIVLIRTLLSLSLETEIEGRWPWNRAKGCGSAGTGD